jgi:hypothetical protein
MPKFIQIKRTCKCEVISVILEKSEAVYPLIPITQTRIPITQTRGELEEMHLFGVAYRDLRESISSNGFNPGGTGVRILWERAVNDYSGICGRRYRPPRPSHHLSIPGLWPG